VKHLYWVLQALTETHTGHWVTLLNQLLCELRLVNDQGWQCLITLDESKFYLAPDHEQIWLRPDQEQPESAKRMIHDKIIIMSIAWNSLGFHFVKALPNRRIDNADYDRADIFTARI
jgi:hypothetical protein